MSLKRKQVKKMLDRVERDGVMWAIKRKGKVVAVVLDWQTWQLLNRKLSWYQMRHESRREDENLQTGRWPVDAGGSVGSYVAFPPQREEHSGIPSRQD